MISIGLLFFRLSVLLYTLTLLVMGIDYCDSCITYSKLEHTPFKRTLYIVGYTIVQVMMYTFCILIVSYAAFDMFHTFFDLIGGIL